MSHLTIVCHNVSRWNAIHDIYAENCLHIHHCDIVQSHFKVETWIDCNVNPWLAERDFEYNERMMMLMSKVLIPSESERAIHQDSTYPSDSLVGHPGMLLRDITVKGFQERPQRIWSKCLSWRKFVGFRIICLKMWLFASTESKHCLFRVNWISMRKKLLL